MMLLKIVCSLQWKCYSTHSFTAMPAPTTPFLLSLRDDLLRSGHKCCQEEVIVPQGHLHCARLEVGCLVKSRPGPAVALAEVLFDALKARVARAG